MAVYDFDSVIDRRNTNSIKWDFLNKFLCEQDVLPMWIADMDFKSPPPVIDALKQIADRGVYGYTGVPQSYYDSLINWMKKRHGWDIKKDWVVFSPGVVPALHMLIQSFSESGDQVIVQTPVYHPFFHAINNTGREILENPLRLKGDQYLMDIADLEKKINPRTKMIILCNPHNPVSRVWSKEELQDLAELCLKYKIIVVSDEIHSDLIYKGYKHIPFYMISEELAENSIVCTAASKTFNLPGLHTSNIVVRNPDLRKRFTGIVKSFGFMVPNMFGLAATEAAYRHGEPWLLELLDYLEGNIRLVKERISHISGLKLIQPQGTYLLWLDFRGCGIPRDKLADFVREKAKVGLEMGTVFGTKEPGFERMNIACPRKFLAEALDKIEQAIKLF
jgi:cysteine-S-conjugate beta-lyase